MAVQSQPLALLCVLILIVLPQAGNAFAGPRLSEGSDLEFGGEGKGKGKFIHLKDMVFDGQSRLYVLDGAEPGKEGLSGNGLVQKFDDQGRFLGEFSVIDPKLAKKNGPAHLAVDSRGHVFVTVPRANLMQEYDADGKLVHAIPVPKAFAIAVRTLKGKEQVLVLPTSAKTEAGDELTILEADSLEADGFRRSVLKLDRGMHHGLAIRADAAANLYIQADTRQIYKFNPGGKLLGILGGGTTFNTHDGSELLGTVAIDSHGNVYGNTPGSPSLISRFDPGCNTVTQRKGQFNAMVAWGPATILAVDRNDRLWAAVPGKDPHNPRQHFRPCIMRLEQDYFAPDDPAVSTQSTTALGLHLAIEDDVPQRRLRPGADLRPPRRRGEHSPRAAVGRRLGRVRFRQERGRQGPFPHAAGRRPRGPPDNYLHAAAVRLVRRHFRGPAGDELLMAVGQQIGVTPKYPGMIRVEARRGPWQHGRRPAAGLHRLDAHAGQHESALGSAGADRGDGQKIRREPAGAIRDAEVLHGGTCPRGRHALQGPGEVLGGDERAEPLHVAGDLRADAQGIVPHHQAHRSAGEGHGADLLWH